MKTHWYKGVGIKVVLSIIGTVVLMNGFFSYVYLAIQERHLNGTVIKTASQLSDTIRKSIQFDMLENRKEHAYKIMETIGQQEGIEKVRIYSREGKILFSTDRSELGRMVQKEAEACTACHSEANPTTRLSTSARSRIFRSDDRSELSGPGHRVLGIINPLYNEKECSQGPCHAHPAQQRVLGVIDVTMSLEDADREIGKAREQVILFSVITIVAMSTVVSVILHRFVNVPVRELVVGTRRISDGDLDHVIPVLSDDEIGHLAKSFNLMTGNLKKANEEIHGLVRDLERKVDERTTELQEAQAQLFHSEKLIAIGKLAATVAHEINNPLTGVFTYIRLIERRMEQGRIDPADVEKYKGFLATMRREVERTTAIVQNLLDFTRPKEPSRRSVDVIGLIEESLSLIGNRMAISNIAIVNNLSPLPPIMADPSQLKQVFLNVMVNACEAMEGGGTFTMRSRYKEAERMVSLSFCDTGVGIPAEHLARVFDPFFTTKEKGTGLGLSVVYGIVEKHNGKVEVKSRPGAGTLIRIKLPVD